MTFDEQYGTDTGGIIGATPELDIVGDNLCYNYGFESVPEEIFPEMVMGIPWHEHQVTDFHFVDLGSGKGRAAMLASQYRFRIITGVESSRVLADVADKNWGVFASRGALLSLVESICADAVDYKFPDDPLVVFVNSPFERPITAIVMAHLETSLHKNPRPAYLIWYTPAQRDVVAAVTHFIHIKESHDYDLYEWRK